MLKEFKEFALKGNVIDLAVGVVIGGAFGKIVTSLVNDIIMPLLSLIIGGISFSDMKYVITPASGDVAEVAILYGNFIQTTIDFVIIAFSIFLCIKLISRFSGHLKKETPAAPEETAPEVPGKEELLLTEIRDLLKNNSTR